jgi:hypothetical protein
MAHNISFTKSKILFLIPSSMAFPEKPSSSTPLGTPAAAAAVPTKTSGTLKVKHPSVDLAVCQALTDGKATDRVELVMSETYVQQIADPQMDSNIAVKPFLLAEDNGGKAITKSGVLMSTFVKSVSEPFNNRYTVCFYPFTESEALAFAQKTVQAEFQALNPNATIDKKESARQVRIEAEKRLSKYHLLLLSLQTCPGDADHRRLSLWLPKDKQFVQQMFKFQRPVVRPPREDPMIQSVLSLLKSSLKLTDTEQELILSEMEKKP